MKLKTNLIKLLALGVLVASSGVAVSKENCKPFKKQLQKAQAMKVVKAAKQVGCWYAMNNPKQIDKLKADGYKPPYPGVCAATRQALQKKKVMKAAMQLSQCQRKNMAEAQAKNEPSNVTIDQSLQSAS